MQTQTAQAVNDVVDHLAAKLSVPVQHLWAILTRQGRAEAIASFAWAAFCLALACVVLILARRLRAYLVGIDADYDRRHDAWAAKASSDNDYRYWDERRPDVWGAVATVRVATVLICAVLAAAACGSAITGVKLIQNPEYFALQQILSAVK